jgi:hypothetical protein
MDIFGIEFLSYFILFNVMGSSKLFMKYSLEPYLTSWDCQSYSRQWSYDMAHYWRDPDHQQVLPNLPSRSFNELVLQFYNQYLHNCSRSIMKLQLNVVREFDISPHNTTQFVRLRITFVKLNKVLELFHTKISYLSLLTSAWHVNQSN